MLMLEPQIVIGLENNLIRISTLCTTIFIGSICFSHGALAEEVVPAYMPTTIVDQPTGITQAEPVSDRELEVAKPVLATDSPKAIDAVTREKTVNNAAVPKSVGEAVVETEVVETGVVESTVVETEAAIETEVAVETEVTAETVVETATIAEGETITEGDATKAQASAQVNAGSSSSVSETPKTSLMEKLAQELSGNASVAAAQPPLFILDTEVPAGTSARLDWRPGSSFMGISAPTAVLVLNGVHEGPTLCITAAVHGDELNGIEIVRRLMYDILPSELSGAIIGVPIVNVEGFRRSSRYLPDRRDLNRFFPGNPTGSSASRIAYSFFTEVITHCDMLIDLHTGSFGRTNLPQLRANLVDPKVADLSTKMGSIVVLQSQGAEGTLRRAATESGVPAVTLEAGAPHALQKKAVDHSVKSIETAMDNLGMIDRRRFWERKTEPVYYTSTWVRARDGGILFSEVSLGANVQAGDVLGVVTDPITNRSFKLRAPFDGRVIGMALNQVLNPGFAAFHIGLKASVEDAAQDVAIDESEKIIPTPETENTHNESEMVHDKPMIPSEDDDGYSDEGSEVSPLEGVPTLEDMDFTQQENLD